MNPSYSYLPKIGDVILCTDADIGILIDIWNDVDGMTVKVAWNSGQILTDAWDSQDFDTGRGMFSILSRA
ncbi:hypothetical protein CMI47_13365 [Candidatus Pacearchaeota archaeon]|nr:hypothetical protein [Candidatus Pacearchaeota archaeon]